MRCIIIAFLDSTETETFQNEIPNFFAKLTFNMPNKAF